MSNAVLRAIRVSQPLVVAIILSFPSVGCQLLFPKHADAGPESDAGVNGDAGQPSDGGPGDAGQPDDAGPGDAGPNDGGPGDAGTCCHQGDTQSCTGTCGLSGTQTCQASCEWGTCQLTVTPPCQPSQTQSCTDSCGGAGTQTCTGSCEWGTCEANQPAVCDPSETRACTDACGATGTQTCTNSCDWGTCDTGNCAPFDTRGCTNTCGNQGFQTCSDTCQWGACEGGQLGVCTPSATLSCTDDCGNPGTQTCSGTCDWGTCQTNASCNLGTVEILASSDAALLCSNVNGSLQGCTETAADHCASACCEEQIGLTGGGTFCYSARYLVRFPHLADSIPPGANVTSVKLQLYVDGTPRSSCTFQAGALTAAWSDGTINWNNMPSSTNGFSGSSPTTGGFWSADVTTDALAQINGTAMENGWLVRAQNDTDCLNSPANYNTDCSLSLPVICEDPSLQNSQWPRLVVKYTQ